MAEQDNNKSSEESSLGGRLQINYIKSNHFRVIHADGAIGGISPTAAVLINFYSERPPIPQIQVHRLSPEGRMSEEIEEERVGRNGMVREVETLVHMDLNAARALATWLNDRVRDAETLIASAKAKGSGRE